MKCEQCDKEFPETYILNLHTKWMHPVSQKDGADDEINANNHLNSKSKDFEEVSEEKQQEILQPGNENTAVNNMAKETNNYSDFNLKCNF